MTVREAISVLTDAKELYIGWDSNINPIDRNDELMMDAFGSYRVKKIVSGTEGDTYEIHIASIPVKEATA